MKQELTAEYIKENIKIEENHNDFCENPLKEWYCKEDLICFLPDDLGTIEESEIEEALETIKENKLIRFNISKNEHGLVRYTAHGVGECTSQCFDTSSNIGFIALSGDFVGGKIEKEVEKIVDGIMQDFTDWCNGACYILNAYKKVSNEAIINSTDPFTGITTASMDKTVEWEVLEDFNYSCFENVLEQTKECMQKEIIDSLLK